MQQDAGVDPAIRDAKSWEASRFASFEGSEEEFSERITRQIQHSFSGHERNRLFVNGPSSQFRDLSGVSGLDSEADGRVLVKWDYDRDGRPDIAVVNSNRPLLNIYRNQLGDQEPAGRRNQFIAVRFVGGNHTSEADSEYAARDGYGAQVAVSAGDLKLVREHRCGEGMAAQNSATMLIGIGERQVAQSVVVRWPSGREQRTTNVDAGTLLTFYENPAHSGGESGIVSTSYVRELHMNDVVADPPARIDIETLLNGQTPDPDKLYVFATMATWCAACKSQIPQFKHLQAELGPKSLALYGVPIDKDDSPDKLRDYVKQQTPSYELLAETQFDERQRFQQTLAQAVRSEAMPATLVTDATGKILLATKSVPTLSQLKKAARRFAAASQPGADVRPK